MPFPSIPIDLIFSDTVQARSVVWVNPGGTPSKDAAGGRKAVPGPWSCSFNCAVSAAGAVDVANHSRENMIVTHVVTCSTRLGGVRDQLLWSETGAILTIVGTEPAGDNTGRIWNHYVEERPL